MSESEKESICPSVTVCACCACVSFACVRYVCVCSRLQQCKCSCSFSSIIPKDTQWSVLLTCKVGIPKFVGVHIRRKKHAEILMLRHHSYERKKREFDVETSVL